ncbi:hypothetical protein O0L34_g14106 [Tuta absoluta]|nr:hypothetical protein O0L34_g14106 [Tuta absoluta]
MNCNSIVIIVGLVCIINLKNSYQSPDTGELDPNIEFFNYNKDVVRRKTSIIYLDSTDAPRKTIFIRRKLKRKKIPRKRKLRARIEKPKWPLNESDDQQIQPVPYQLHKKDIKQPRIGTKPRYVTLPMIDTKPRFTLPRIGRKQRIITDPSIVRNHINTKRNKGVYKNRIIKKRKTRKHIERDPKKRKPVDIIVHIKMKE